MGKPATSVNQDAVPAIPARHNRLAEELIYRLLVRWPTWSQFDKVWFKLEGALPNPGDGPLICYLNHPSWWDGYVAMLLHRLVFHRSFENYLMMDEQQLRRYRFFAWTGVFSVRLNDVAEAGRSVAYISRLLRERSDRCLWIFPQGKITPNDQRPLRLYPGVARIVRKAGGATLLPVALRYEFRNEQRPEMFIRVGPAHRAPASASERAVSQEVRENLTRAVDALRHDVTQDQLDGYRVLLQGRTGINRISDALFGALRLRLRG